MATLSRRQIDVFSLEAEVTEVDPVEDHELFMASEDHSKQHCTYSHLIYKYIYTYDNLNKYNFEVLTFKLCVSEVN